MNNNSSASPEAGRGWSDEAMIAGNPRRSITAADVVAFLEQQCADVRRLTGCETASISANNRVSSPANIADHSYWSVHAHGECATDEDLEVAKSQLLSKLARPAELAARRRAEAAKLLAEADALAPQPMEAGA